MLQAGVRQSIVNRGTSRVASAAATRRARLAIWEVRPAIHKEHTAEHRCKSRPCDPRPCFI
eukprot:1153226-Alexandrium_andersonii.AAC.1